MIHNIRSPENSSDRKTLYRLPLINTERLMLLPFSLNDVEELHQMWREERMRKFLWDDRVISFSEADETVREAVAAAENTGIGMWSIARIENEQERIGFCGLRFIAGTEEVEMLYGLLSGWSNRGYALEAAREIVAYFFQNFTAQRVFAGSDPLNHSSFRVMERLGMKPVPDGSVPVPGAMYYCLNRLDFK